MHESGPMSTAITRLAPRMKALRITNRPTGPAPKTATGIAMYFVDSEVGTNALGPGESVKGGAERRALAAHLYNSPDPSSASGG